MGAFQDKCIKLLIKVKERYFGKIIPFPIFCEFFKILPILAPRAKRCKLSDIVFMTIVALLSGYDDWNDTEFYSHSKHTWLSQYLEMPIGIPSYDTFNTVFSALDPLELQ